MGRDYEHLVILECTWFKLRKGLVKDKERIKGFDSIGLKGLDITGLLKNTTGLINWILQD